MHNSVVLCRYLHMFPNYLHDLQNADAQIDLIQQCVSCAPILYTNTNTTFHYHMYVCNEGLGR